MSGGGDGNAMFSIRISCTFCCTVGKLLFFTITHHGSDEANLQNPPQQRKSEHDMDISRVSLSSQYVFVLPKRSHDLLFPFFVRVFHCFSPVFLFRIIL